MYCLNGMRMVQDQHYCMRVKQLAEETGPDYIWLDTHIDNEKAIRLYEKNGFTKMERYFFIIGTQVFEYHLMAMPVAIAIRTTC